MGFGVNIHSHSYQSGISYAGGVHAVTKQTAGVSPHCSYTSLKSLTLGGYRTRLITFKRIQIEQCHIFYTCHGLSLSTISPLSLQLTAMDCRLVRLQWIGALLVNHVLRWAATCLWSTAAKMVRHTICTSTMQRVFLCKTIL